MTPLTGTVGSNPVSHPNIYAYTHTHTHTTLETTGNVTGLNKTFTGSIKLVTM
jgi:hypothetical protein